jgi:hypothetical protein
VITPAPSGKDSEHCAGAKLMGPRHQHRPGHCAGASGTISHSHPLPCVLNGRLPVCQCGAASQRRMPRSPSNTHGRRRLLPEWGGSVCLAERAS